VRILLLEDDIDLGEAIYQSLLDLDEAVDWFKTVEQAETALETEHFDLLLLDLTLPDRDGLDFLKQLRIESMIPVIIITARDQIENRIQGLNLGADDYVAKPFDVAELYARIQSVHRRVHGLSKNELVWRDWVLDIDNRQLFIQEDEVELPGKEFAVLKILMERQGKVVSKYLLEESLYNWEDAVSSNSIEVHIHHLRKKLPKGAIKTIRGLGYQLVN